MSPAEITSADTAATDITVADTTSADTTDFTAVHTCLRNGSRALAAAVAELDPRDRQRVTALQRYWRGYAGEVLAHHTIEDDVLYPALAERSPVAVEHLGRIDADHHLLDELMDEAHAAFAAIGAGAVPAAAVQVLVRLDELMHQHLDFEDSELVPLFRTHFDRAEYHALTQAATKSIGIGKQALFTVPFIGNGVSPDVRAHLFASAPPPFKVLYHLTRRRHDRLARRALGDAGALVTAPGQVTR